MTTLLIMGFMLFGPLFALTDNAGAEDEEEFPPDETMGPEDEGIAFEERPDLARAPLPQDGSFSAGRGTDAEQDFVGAAGVRNAYDASGGDDTLTGAELADVLIGGEDSDQIAGGEGDDVLFGAFQRASRADDMDADTLDGGAGDDTLFLGNGDQGIGGLGADSFVALQDADGIFTIVDFDGDEDAILIENPTPEDISVTGQTVDETGLSVTLSTGLTIALPGVDNPLAEDAILFVDVAPLETA